MSTEFVIELPDELADRLAEEPDISAFVTECVRKDMADERTLHTLRQAGFALSPARLEQAGRPAMDLAQAAVEAARAITPIMTDRRELLGEVLPKEWPIIDL
ncbi:hypothetical protein ACIBD9_27235 [Micromonospora sp. NPDC050784]|uniref:hypothetical protein n=1 Tax=Micromonospora sp. NPDC050784 TaxID=3364281 RepID=UPI0037A298DC